MGLDAERTAWALGLAGTQGAGLWAFNADGTMSKRLHAGKAAHSGVLAAELAAAGFSGPTQIYETQDGGFLKAFSDKSDLRRSRANSARDSTPTAYRSSPIRAVAAPTPISMRRSKFVVASAMTGIRCARCVSA
jgi:2-methylcitrate dehydratase PrpD